MKKNIRFASYLLLPSLLLSAAACTDNNVVDNTDPAATNSDGQIVVKVASDDFLASRAGVGKAFPLTETSEGTLALVVVDTPMGAASPAVADDDKATRGVPITTDNFGEEYGKFKIVGYLAGSNSTTGAPMPTTDVLYNSISEDYPWTPDCPPCYWPTSGDAVDFWAYAPAVCTGRSTPAIDGANGTMSFDYTLPAHQTDNEDARRELDLMVAAELGIDATDHNGEVVLKFKHALSTISFQTKRVPDGAVKTIALKGIYNAGTCTYTPSLDPASPSYVPSTDASYDEDNDPSAGISWGLGTTTGSFTQKFGLEDNGQYVSSSGYTQLTGKDPERTFVVIPQTAPDDAYLELSFEWDPSFVPSGDRTQKFVVDLSGFEWKAGHAYMYNIITIPNETANCYIADKPGLHLVPAFCMGNRQDYILSAPEGHTYKADVLWSDCGLSNDSRTDGSASFQSAVTDVNYFVMDDGKGYFLYRIGVDPNTGEAYRGNAVISVYDDDTKTIIWNWHIWMTEEPEVVYTGGSCDGRSYTSASYTFSSDKAEGLMAIMDRNLGAISADPNDGWKTYGLYYQMGRYNPFIGGSSNGSNVHSGTGEAVVDGVKDKGYFKEKVTTVYMNEDTPFDNTEFTTRTWWNDELAPNGWNFMDDGYLTITQSIQQPMTLANNPATGGWWTQYDCLDNQTYMSSDLGYASATHGITGLDDDGHEAYWNRTKTIFDPCPNGWTVLGEGSGAYFNGDAKTAVASGNAFGLSTQFTAGKDGTTYDPVWWPAAGFRATNGRMAEVGYYGMYFNYDHINNQHGGHGVLLQSNSTTVVTDAKTNMASSMRCVRSEQPTTGGGGHK